MEGSSQCAVAYFVCARHGLFFHVGGTSNYTPVDHPCSNPLCPDCVTTHYNLACLSFAANLLLPLIIDRVRVISIVYSIKGISGLYLNVQVNVSLCLATPCDTYTLSFLLNVCTCLGVAGRQSIDYATFPTTLYSALFCSLFIIMYVVENKSITITITIIIFENNLGYYILHVIFTIKPCHANNNIVSIVEFGRIYVVNTALYYLPKCPLDH